MKDSTKFILLGLGLAGLSLVGKLFFDESPSDSEITEEKFETFQNPANDSDERYGGIPLSKLDELAKEIYHGMGCTINQEGYLVFHYRSRRGHERYHTLMGINQDGNLCKIHDDVYYPGQWWNGGDEFVKRANEQFEFYKE